MAKRKPTLVEQWSTYSGLALLLPAATFVGYLIGYLLDKAFGTHFLYIPFLLLGIVAGIVQLIRGVTKDSGDGDS
ncbi:MAG TPA: AtpZ/AtpI family protein [Bryobacteraceae bacterium]|nr:AtpZ/AtpI family protein [Bryobacteraceae bacterium]